MTENLEVDQVLAIVSKSYFLSYIIGKRAFKRLQKQKELPDIDRTPVSVVIEKILNLEDLIHIINSDKFLSFRIVSDDEGKSECGPWQVNVFGVCGVWLVSSIDYDNLWFDDRDIAISAAYDYAHESIIEEIDHGVLEFQQTNSEVDQAKKACEVKLPLILQKSELEKRVLGFYLENDSNQIYCHSKYGLDSKSDVTRLISTAFNASEFEVLSALTKANELKWEEATSALNVVLDVKKRVSNLEHEIQKLKTNRIIEIIVDDWFRKNEISEPKMEDFVRMAAALKPFLRYREASKFWDINMPTNYRDAYTRLVNERKKIEAERSKPDEG